MIVINMENIEIQIYGYNHKLIKIINPSKKSDFFFFYEMFNGTRSFDLTSQVNELISQGLKENRKQYSLFCTYTKFGEVEQEQADFDVIIKCRN